MGFLRKVSKITSGLFFRFSGVLDMGSEKIVNVADGTNPQDAATKAQIDAIVTGTGFMAVDGTTPMTGVLNMNTHKISGVVDPTANQEAATKKYADDVGGLMVKKDGSVAMTGALDLGTHKINNVVDPAANQDAATKKYADDVGALMVKKDGTVAMTGALDLSTHKINNVVDPAANQDAATKKYVDDQIDAVNEDLLADAKTSVLRHGVVTLIDGILAVIFKASSKATIKGTEQEPFDLTGVGDGGTILVEVDEEGEKTATVNFSAGKKTGGTAALTDLSLETDTKFKISVDDDEPETVTCDWTGCVTGLLIAAEMEEKIQAKGEKKALVTVAFDTNKYVITSPTLGKNSLIRITAADDHDCCDELQISADYGSYTDGAGDVDDASEVYASEIAAVINGDMTEFVDAEDDDGYVRITSKVAGHVSYLFMGNSTLKTVLGLGQGREEFGFDGLGYDTDMADDDYTVVATLKDAAQAGLGLVDKGLSITNIGTAGFTVECEDDTSVDDVFVLIAGLGAS